MELLNVINTISVILTLVYLVVVFGFIRGWGKLISFKPAGIKARTVVSVIIAARNEAGGIKRTIECLLAQDYDPALTELIFIDDHSTDNTAEVVLSYASRGVKLISLKADAATNSYKKKAIQTAIGQARGTLIITTDADCRMGSRWLSTVVACYEEKGYKMISSPVVYDEERSFFERAQSLEFLYLIGLGASTIGNKKPSTCNGANLAYEKEAFYAVGGFQGIDDLASGDDELLLHKMAAADGNSIGFLKNKDAIVYTHAKPDLREFLQQRKRWASKSTRYKNKSIIVLGVFVWLFNLSILINLVTALFMPEFWPVLICQLILKIGIEYYFLRSVTAFAGRTSLLKLLPVLNLFHIVYIIYIGIAGNSGKYEWKSRIVR